MMEYDMQKEARVWQRVQEGKQPLHRQGESISRLITEQMQLSSQYLQLSRQRTGRDGAALMSLARQARIQAACLRGIAAMGADSTPPSAVQAQNMTHEASLRRCYGQELRLLKEYEDRCSDAQFGAAFEILARRAQEHCCKILELIGSTGK